MKRILIGAIATTIAATSATAFADDDHKKNEKVPAQTSTTTTTAADATSPTVSSSDPAFAPSMTTRPSERDTVTLYQTVRPNKAFLYSGGGLFIGSYVPTAVVTAVNDLDRSLYIPVVGPWLHLADMPDGASTGDTLLVAGSGVLQGAGVLLMTASLFVPEKIPAATIQAGDVKMNLTPVAYGRGAGGFGAVGTF